MKHPLVVSMAILVLTAFCNGAPQADKPAVANRVTIEGVHPDKLLYHPGEKGVIRVNATNKSATACKATIVVSIVSDLNDPAARMSQPVEIAANESKVVEFPFTADQRLYGHEIRVALADDSTKAPALTARDYFAVADNFYQVGIGGTTSPIFSDKQAKLKKLLDVSRKNYCNWFDMFFWAPCDWSLLVSPLPQWWSGQTSYPHDEANLKAFIAECHANGMSLAAYASCNPAGPFGWELARQHPQWFTDSAGHLPSLEAADLEALEHWNDPAWRATHKFSKWLGLHVDLRRLDALDWGIHQLSDSATHYGWDAVRFDGHYTITASDDLSTRNMRRLKETVWKEHPEFRFGFNYGRAPEWRGGVTHEMREAMAGGGMYMQEGIRNWRYTGASYTSWQHYATNELRIAKEIQSMGGSYHCIWGITKGSPPEQSAYKFIYGLIAGGHPAYGDHMSAPGCDNWGAFMTRWSGFLWDGSIRSVAEPQRQVLVTGLGESTWKPFVQERMQSPTRRFLIVHLVNPPTSDEIAKTAYPEPLKKIGLTFPLQVGEEIRKIVLIRPDRQAFDTELNAISGNAMARVEVDEVKLWGMVVVELAGKYAEPVARSKFTEPPDEAKVAAAMAGRLTARIVDPSKPAEVELPPGERIWPTDRGFAGIGARVELDEQAVNSAAQVQSWDNQKQGNNRRFMGQTWLGPLPAGKYRLGYHVKWTAGGNNAAWRARLYIRSTTSKKKEDLTVSEMASPNCWDQPGDALDAFLGAKWRQARQKFGPANQYDYATVEFELKVASYIHANMIVETDREGPAKFSLDHIKTTLLEPYLDTQQAAWMPVAKPDGLRIPQGGKPDKVLLVKGLYAQQYRVSKLRIAEEMYQLPDKYETLYAYDAMILADVDLTPSTFAQRKILKDFIEDGGRLVILGGIATLGQGGMANTYIEDLAPIALKGRGEVIADAAPSILGLKPDQPAADKPAIFWRHNVTFRPEAHIFAYAGEHPIAARRTAGKGRVIVFTGTVLGTGNAEFKPFWETATWIELLQRCISGDD